MPSSAPPPRRARYQCTPSGLFASDIAHPLIVGKRLHLAAKSPRELDEYKRVVDGWTREYRLNALSLESFRERLARFTNPRAPQRTLRAAWGTYGETCTAEMAPKLASIWKNQIAPELGELALTELTARRLTLWDKKLEAQGYAGSTAANTFVYLTACVRLALGEHEDLPWRMGPRKYWRPPRPTTPAKERPACGTVEEAELLIHAALEADRAQRCDDSSQAWRLADLGQRIAVALFLALRNGELGGLGWDDLVLDPPCPRALVRHQATSQWRRHHPEWTRPLAAPKGRKKRQLILHPTAVAALHAQRELLDARGWYRADGPVFPGHDGTPFAGTWRNNSRTIHPEEMRAIARVAGLPDAEDWVTHCLRHSHATLESTSGADLKSIQNRTGHSSLRRLEIYIHQRTGRALAPSAVPELAVTFDAEHDTEPCPPPDAGDDEGGSP